MKSIVVGIGRVLSKHAILLSNFSHLPPNTKSRVLRYQPRRLLFNNFTRGMKRKATESSTNSKAKRQKEPDADYCDVVSRKDSSGNTIWPASEQAIERARDFLQEW